jgi:hypothetical protein
LHEGVEVGSSDETAAIQQLAAPLSDYVRVFVERWNRKLQDTVSLTWQVASSPVSSIIAAVFRAHERAASFDENRLDFGVEVMQYDVASLLRALSTLGGNMPSDLGRHIATEGIVRIIGGDYFVIVKRNERRLWSASAAREDFEATLLSAMRMRA